jgi:hypothetical protein
MQEAKTRAGSLCAVVHAVTAALCMVCSPAAAQDASSGTRTGAGPNSGPGSGSDTAAEASAKQQQQPDQPATAGDKPPGEVKAKKVDLLIAPIPLSDPERGTGLAVGAIAFYNPNHEPNQWISGVGAIYTSRGTAGIGGYHSMSFDQDHWRLAGTFSYIDSHSHYYGIGDEAGNRGEIMNLNTTDITFQVDLLRRVTPHGFVGLRYRLFDTDGGPEEPPTPTLPAPPPDQLNSTLSALGPSLAYDTRDSTLAPHSGAYITSVWLFGIKALGDSFAHNRMRTSAAGYFTVGPKTVLAVRGSLCSAGGHVPYYDLCQFGEYRDLRGYPSGRYRDRASWATQAEVRQRILDRWGAVAFFGIGGIAPSFGDIFTHGNVLPAGGVGARYQPFRNNAVNIRFDIAFGKDEHTVYLGIGEAF